ncbi:MAG: S8 family serine peptidase [Betaproteobacteria bacterium]
MQSELNAAAITDPNAVVRSVSQVAAASTSTGYKSVDYDLRWGTPDPKGPGYANLYAKGDWHPAEPLYFWGQRLSGQGFLGAYGPNIGAPASEVMDAWKLGWTGKGVNILMEDFLYFNEGAYHGVITSLLAYRYAPGATLYGWNIDSASLNTSIVDIDNNNVPTKTGTLIKLGVVNASYVGLNPNADYQAVTSRFMNPSFQGQVNYTDAVITKAAGNDRRSSEMEPINKAMAGIPSLSNRVLIVGALNKAGDVNSPAYIASYSNTAGTDPLVNSRYLLASGTTPFNSGDLAVEGLAINSTNSYYSNAGTSYAAPRVAGMVAIVRSKFPNLSASQTASIMLDTAHYDTLTCYPACDPAIYGRGEASLSRALAPVGKLR